MNAMNFFRGLIITTSIIFYSCENEPVDPQPVSPISSVSCSLPSNVTAARATDTSLATLLWTANGDQNSWQVQYGNAGFVLGSGTIVYSNATSKIFTGLSDTVAYDFYVRSQCSENQFSEWVGPINVPVVGGVASGDYWPRAVQNQWIFSIDNVNEQPWKINGTELINGNTYYTFLPIDGKPLRKIRKSAIGDYFDRYEDYTGDDLTIVTGNETIILKDYLPVNGTWTDTYTETTTTVGMPSVDLNVQIVSTITQRGTAVTVPDRKSVV